MKRIGWHAIGLLCALALPTAAQQVVRDSAIALFDNGKHREALALLERVVAAGSADRRVYETLGFAVLETSGAPSSAAERQQLRARARSMFAKAVSLGSTSQQILTIMATIPEDGGSDVVFSGNKEVNEAMGRAEAAYSGGDYRLAFTLYQKALALDPALYDAAMFSGDTYLHTLPIDSAYIWYARATEINPNRETAWRYWSDVLLKHGDPDQALEKAIESVIGDPFNRMSREALIAWAQAGKRAMAFPKVILPVRDTATVHAPAWMAYDSVRRSWQGSGGKPTATFTAQYPRDSVYRHSVLEEKAALQAAYRAGAGDPATVNLKLLDDAGMLEAFIFFTRADQGVAEDYPAYLKAHRDTLRRFWAEFVVGARYAK